MLVDTVGRDSIGQWMGTALSSSSFGLIISPFLGGVVYAKAGYMAVFGMAMGLIVLDVVMRMFMIEKKTAAKYLPAETVTTANGFYGTFTDEEVREENASRIEDSASDSDAICHGAYNEERDSLIRKPSRSREPNVDPYEPPTEQPDRQTKKSTRVPTIITLLSSPRLLAAIYGIFVNVSVLAAFDGVLPIFVKRTFHWDSLAAGLIFLCIGIPALAGPLVGQVSDRYGPRWIAVAGCSLSAVPLILLRLVDHDSHEQKILLCALLFLCGTSEPSPCHRCDVASPFSSILAFSIPCKYRY